MAKSHKTKKHVKEEKSKIKLKTKDSKTKFLPKGANVTDVNFKIKQIVIPQQLQAHNENEIVSKRKLNIKDLLSRLKHYNTSIKSDALEDLIEVFSTYKGQSVSVILHSYISQILQTACRLLLDKEKSVRHKTIKLIALIISSVDKDKIYPFSNILISHLKCSMTDIDKNVQADSLLMLDSLVTHFPEIIIEKSSQILPIFFILISSVQNNSSKNKLLTLNLSSTSTSTRWRLQVLSRLQRVLTTIISSNEQTMTSNNDVLKLTFFANKQHFLPIYNNYWSNYPFNYNTSSVQEDLEEPHSNSSTINYVNSLIPLLYDTWLEVIPDNPNQKEKNDDTILSQEAASIFKSILTIFYLLWQLAKREGEKSAQEMFNSFSNKVGMKFLNRVLNQFPYSQSTSSRHIKEFKDILEPNTDLKCIDLNLLVCYIFCVTNRKINSEQQKLQCQKVLEYLKKCLLNRNYVKENNFHYLTKILSTILLNNSFNWIKNGVNVIEILDGLVHFYQYTTFADKDGTEIIKILCEVAQTEHLNSSEKYQNWLSDLPSYLAQIDPPLSVINTVALLSKQNNSLIEKGFMNNYEKIIDSLFKFKVENEEVKSRLLKILSCFFYSPQYRNNVKRYFQENITKHSGLPVAKIIEETIQFSKTLC